MRVIFNHYVKRRVTFTVGPGKLGPGPARSPQNYYLPARAWPGPASFRPAPCPARNIYLKPGPAHGLRAGPAYGPRPGPCRTLLCTSLIKLLGSTVLIGRREKQSGFIDNTVSQCYWCEPQMKASPRFGDRLIVES